jgi:hypothetical protein
LAEAGKEDKRPNSYPQMRLKTQNEIVLRLS